MLNWRFLYSTVSTLKPMVGRVVGTNSFCFNLNRMDVLPALFRPNITRRISIFGPSTHSECIVNAHAIKKEHTRGHYIIYCKPNVGYKVCIYCSCHSQSFIGLVELQVQTNLCGPYCPWWMWWAHWDHMMTHSQQLHFHLHYLPRWTHWCRKNWN